MSEHTENSATAHQSNASVDEHDSGAVEVLVVEDDQTLADLYSDWLDDEFRVRTAYDGRDGWEQFDESVDVVLLDRLMPELSGDEVLKRIRDSGIDCQVVMVSAVQPGFDIVQMGFDAYVQKPTTAAELRQTVDQMTTRAEYDDRLRELFSLMERQSTLEASADSESLEESDEYAELTERLAQVQNSVETLLTGLPDEDFRAAVERMQRMKTERQERRRNESLTNDVMDTSREGTIVIDADGTVVWMNEAVETLLGVDRSTLTNESYPDVAADVYEGIEASDEMLGDVARQALESDQEHSTVVTVSESEGQPSRQLEYWSAPIETGLYAGGRIEHFHDVTRQYEREETLRTLQQITRQLVSVSTEEAVLRTIVESATDELSFPFAALFRWDETTGELRPVNEAGSIDTAVELPTVRDGEGPLWSAFTTGETHHCRQFVERDKKPPEWLEAIGRWALCPLAHRGVLLVSIPESDRGYNSDLDLAEAWAANAERALIRLKQDAKLRDRDRRLERQNSRLERLDRINRLIRSIGKVIVSAETREEIEREVCQQVTGVEHFSFAWIAERPLGTGRPSAKTAAGDGDTYLDTLATRPHDGTGDALPTDRSIEATEPAVIQDVLSVTTDTWWRREALSLGHHAILAVPLVHGTVVYGALEIHSTSPQGFEDEEVEALAELGQTIGHGISAVRRKESLLSGGEVELEFELVDESSVLTTVATALGGDITVCDITPTTEGGYAAFIQASVEESAVTQESGHPIHERADVSVVHERPDSTLLKVAVDADSVLTPFIEHGGAVEQLEYRSVGVQRVIVTVDRSVDVRTYVESINEDNETIEFVARRESSGGKGGATERIQAIDETLTDRQREVVQTAFYAGYFTWPREADSSTVASTIGIAQSTFQQHLRRAEEKILSALFERE